jgi:hypothetical protein
MHGMNNTKMVEGICDMVLRKYLNQREREGAGENCIVKRFRKFSPHLKLLR